MGYSRKFVADVHPSNPPVSQDKIRISSRRARSTGRTNSSVIDVNARKAVKSVFLEDFALEHSRPGPHANLIALVGCF
jgi:hypothetical protein